MENEEVNKFFRSCTNSQETHRDKNIFAVLISRSKYAIETVVHIILLRVPDCLGEI